ncbi:MAG: exopolyphosphatase [Nocardioides sp.]|nr:exopolyphosphatase [Nocardioides sp.]
MAEASGPVASVDCGTNTVRLLVLDPATGATLTRKARIVRLGEGVDATGRITRAALDRADEVLREFGEVAAAYGVRRLRVGATSATRDAENGSEFVTAVEQRLGVTPDVLSGAEEAQLTFGGALRHLDPDLPGPVLVADVGGGSTELVLGDAHDRSRIVSADSLQVGSVRLHERHLHDDPPTAAQVAAVRADLDEALRSSPVDAASAATVVGVAGTALTIAAGALRLSPEGLEDDLTPLRGAVLDAEAVHAEVDRIVALPVADRLGGPLMSPGRADVIGAGGLVLSSVLHHAEAERLVVSEADILDGLAWSLVR